MDESDRHILRNGAEYIIDEVVNSGQFQSIVYELKEREVIAPDDAIYILNLEATKTAKMRHLLISLERCKDGAFRVFLEVLLKAGLCQVIQRLDPEMYNNYIVPISARDVLRPQTLPNKRRSMEPLDDHTDNLPTLPRRSSLPVRPYITERNGNPFSQQMPLKIQVTPSKILGGAQYGESLLYKNSSMPRGLVFMVNYKDFRDQQQPTREGSEKDVKNLTLLFSQMGYEIPKVHVNLTKYDTVKALREFKNLEKHKTVDSCIIIIMSHGRDEKSFYTSDNEYLNINDIVERFSNRECEALKGKPKIFIFQYCRGTTPDIGVEFDTHLVMYDRGLPVETDSAAQGQVVIGRDPTFTDMYIVYSTVEGFVSFRSPERGSWLMEAICMVFMEHAHDTELETLMKMVSRIVRQNHNDDGHKQVCEFAQRGFDRHFYFNPQPLNSTGNLCLRSLSKVLAESTDSIGGAVSPIPFHQRRHLRARSRSRSRGRSPDPFGSPRLQRSRNISGASNSSECFDKEIDPANLTSEGVIIHPRARRHSGKQRVGSESFNFMQPSYLPESLSEYNRSFSENILESHEMPRDPSTSPSNEVFTEESQEKPPEPKSFTYDTVDHRNGNTQTNPSETAQLEISDINMNQGTDYEIVTDSRHSIKRQLSIPSSNETLIKLNDVKKYLQVHDSDPNLIAPLQRIESFVNKKKYEGKRRKKDTESCSLEY